MRGAALKIGHFMKIQDSSMLSSELEDVFPCVQNSANCMPEWQSEGHHASHIRLILLSGTGSPPNRIGFILTHTMPHGRATPVSLRTMLRPRRRG
ncbi:hypothetical protein CF319_g9413 [Tilletia indica]|nr:hypothetical protein CF319_g9413 [Tilletia indica]